jgi:hypothetical protein
MQSGHKKILRQKITFEWKHTSEKNFRNCSFDVNFQSMYNGELRLDSIINQLKKNIDQYVLYINADSICEILDENYLLDSITKLENQDRFNKLATDIKKFFNNLEIIISDKDNRSKVIQKFSGWTRNWLHYLIPPSLFYWIIVKLGMKQGWFQNMDYVIKHYRNLISYVSYNQHIHTVLILCGRV